MVFRLIFLRCRRRCRPVPESCCPVIDRTGIPAQHFQVKLQPLPERYYIQIAGSDKGIVSVRRCFIGPGSAAERRCERHHRRPGTVVIVFRSSTHERRERIVIDPYLFIALTIPVRAVVVKRQHIAAIDPATGYGRKIPVEIVRRVIIIVDWNTCFIVVSCMEIECLCRPVEIIDITRDYGCKGNIGPFFETQVRMFRIRHHPTARKGAFAVGRDVPVR